MSSTNILFLIDDVIEDREVLTPLRVLALFGHTLHIASPQREAGEKISLPRATNRSTTAKPDEEHASITLNATLAEAKLPEFDALVLAFGRTSDGVLEDDRLLRIIRFFAEEAGKPVIGLGSGVLALVAADVVRGHRVTCARELAAGVRRAGAEYVESAPSGAVVDRNLVTGVEGGDFPEWIVLLLDALGRGKRENHADPALYANVCRSRESLDTACSPSRFDRGLSTLKAISGGGNYKQFIQTLNRLSPEFGDLLVEVGYADIVSRPGLSLKSRELVTVAALTALGNAPAALKFHCGGMLNTGWSARQLVESVLHAVVYAGFPAVSSALKLVSEVLRERNIELESSPDEPSGGSREIPAEVLKLMVAHDALGGRMEPLLVALIAKFAYGEIWSRPGLSVKDRQLATLAMVMSKGNHIAAVCKHVEGCLMLGWTRAELVEVLIQMTGYIGWPLTLAVTGPALEVFDRFEEDGLPDTSLASVESESFDVQATQAPSPVPQWLETLNARSASREQKSKGADEIGTVLARYSAEFFGGRATGRLGKLDAKTREIAIIAALTATGRMVDMEPLERHVNAAIDVGVQWCEIAEAMELMLPYAGFLSVKQSMGYAYTTCAERPFTS
ncbi:carboxymuconolactone decarboxylase family protein [Paraburkholderia humisilvae]|uniref:Carboxymuconolactone decarboxylase-like domain-containing protein n=1 Tax=Paraburkholderia humisilvae TaxID=627669 RepID=A0A6J5EGM8_9BURK|nr:carboxymuconolactone decarboxylase family protein [Paraburkholderia humisilvae]CAB3764426.1 hypothetical protein LMG29542_04892 [Paraburkholderia humisilvae]